MERTGARSYHLVAGRGAAFGFGGRGCGLGIGLGLGLGFVGTIWWRVGVRRSARADERVAGRLSDGSRPKPPVIRSAKVRCVCSSSPTRWRARAARRGCRG